MMSKQCQDVCGANEQAFQPVSSSNNAFQIQYLSQQGKYKQNSLASSYLYETNAQCPGHPQGHFVWQWVLIAMAQVVMFHVILVGRVID